MHHVSTSGPVTITVDHVIPVDLLFLLTELRSLGQGQLTGRQVVASTGLVKCQWCW